MRRPSARLRYDLSPAERYSDTLVWEMQHTLLGLIAFGEVLTPIRILGILMILVAVVLLTTDKSK